MSSTGHKQIEADLRRAGEIRAESKRLRQEAAEINERTIPKAVKADMPIVKVAELSGLTRQGVYDVLARRA